jgi:hypothetical protein
LSTRIFSPPWRCFVFRIIRILHTIVYRTNLKFAERPSEGMAA